MNENKISNHKYRAYQSYLAMKSRCNNPNRPNYHLYGGRGIKICDRWKSFNYFLEDMGERPEGFQLERIDNNGDYEPNNCKWVTPKENSNNRRIQSHIKDLTGQQIGDWLVLTRTESRGNNGCVKYLCRCKCSREVLVKRYALSAGVSSRCDKCSRNLARLSALQLVGKRFDNWLVVSVSNNRTSSGNILYVCRCDCGIQKELVRSLLEKGKTKSCFDCYVKFRKTLDCNYCGCKGHKEIDVDTSLCDHIGVCPRCDNYNHIKLLAILVGEF